MCMCMCHLYETYFELWNEVPIFHFQSKKFELEYLIRNTVSKRKEVVEMDKGRTSTYASWTVYLYFTFMLLEVK